MHITTLTLGAGMDCGGLLCSSFPTDVLVGPRKGAQSLWVRGLVPGSDAGTELSRAPVHSALRSRALRWQESGLDWSGLWTGRGPSWGGLCGLHLPSLLPTLLEGRHFPPDPGPLQTENKDPGEGMGWVPWLCF